MASKYASRKFGLTLLCLVMSYSALFLDRMDGSQFITVVTLVLGIYSGANVAAKKISPSD